jgi:hypothetical protein
VKTLKLSISTLALICTNILSGYAQQDDRDMLNRVEQDDQKAVDAIAMYPADIRRDIFTAAESPEILVRLNAMQKQTKDRFATLVSPYSRDEQEKIYNLSRYPALIHDLVARQPRNENEMEALLATYPAEVHRTAREEWATNARLIATIDKENNYSQNDLENILHGYSQETANAYRDLVRYPEVLNTLYDNMQLTVVIGDVYRRDPQYVTYKTDSLNQMLTAQNQQATADWTQSMNENPQAQEEYIQASQEYAQENGYSPDEYQAPLNPNVNVYPSYSYNWWFGYPAWYPYAYWDPYPYWADWGYYYGPRRQVIFFGMPSHYFMEWYFYHPEHHSHYPELSNHYYNYYYGHRNARNWNSVSRGVDEWRGRNRDVVNEEWDKDSKGRVQKFKEYGQAESSRITYNKSNRQHPLDRSSFIQQNQTRFPSLKTVPVKNDMSLQNGRNNEQRAPERNPHIAVPDAYRADKNPAPALGNTGNPANQPQGKNPVNGDRQPVTPRDLPAQENNRQPVTPRETPPASNPQPAAEPRRAPAHTNEFHDAQQYHQSTWEQVRPAPQPHYNAPAPAPHFSAPAPRQSGGGGGGRRR